MGFTGFLYQVWTIARQSLVQAVRMKVAVVLVVFMAIMIPSLPFLLKSDDTYEGMLRMVITYSLYLITFLLGILTLFLSTITLNTEIKYQHIYLLDPKPLARGTLLLGKWCGVMLINLILLTAMLGATYGLVRFLAAKMKAKSPQQYDIVQWDVLSARQIATPPLPPLDDWVKKEVQSIKDNKLVPEGKSDAWVEKTVRQRMERAAWTVPTGAVMKWTVSGIPIPKANDAVVVRFRHYSDAQLSDPSLPGRFAVNEGGQPSTRVEQAFSIAKPHFIGVPGTEVKPDGTLSITYQNTYAPRNPGDPPVVTAAFPFEDGIQVLYTAATFGENVVRAGAVIFTRLAFIALVGVWASTFLSFPIAVLLSLVVFIIGYMVDFINTDLIGQMYIFGSSMVPPWWPLNPLDNAIRNILKGFFMVFPNFNKYDVVPNLSDGMIINWGILRDCFLMLIVVRGGILALTGWVIFNRRELAGTGVQT